MPALRMLSNPGLFPQALLYYTNALNDSDAKVQQAACVALQQLGVSPLSSHVTGDQQQPWWQQLEMLSLGQGMGWWGGKRVSPTARGLLVTASSQTPTTEVSTPRDFLTS